MSLAPILSSLKSALFGPDHDPVQMKDKPKAGIQKKRVRRARVDKRLKKLEDEVQLLRAEIDAMRAAKKTKEQNKLQQQETKIVTISEPEQIAPKERKETALRPNEPTKEAKPIPQLRQPRSTINQQQLAINSAPMTVPRITTLPPPPPLVPPQLRPFTANTRTVPLSEHLRSGSSRLRTVPVPRTPGGSIKSMRMGVSTSTSSSPASILRHAFTTQFAGLRHSPQKLIVGDDDDWSEEAN